LSNGYTLATVFGKDPISPELRERHRRMIVDPVLGYLCHP
jgi:hypothetical protein